MDHSIFIKPPKFDAAVWRPEVPLLVIVRCTEPSTDGGRRSVNPASLVFTWLAYRWFSAAYPKQRKFPSRRIAEWMRASQRGVLQWSRILADLGLLHYEGDEVDNRFKRPQPVYSIPLREIEAESNSISLEMILKWQHGPESPDIPPDEQLALGLDDPPHQDGEEKAASAINCQQSSRSNDRNGLRSNDRNGLRSNDRNGLRSNDRNDRDQMIAHGWMDGMDGWMDSAPAPKKRGRPPKIPPAPTAEVYAAHPIWIVGGPLPAHPRDLWTNACPAPTAAHADQLAALAAEHDAPTDGHGWYWVGRAILAGLHAQEQLGHPNYLRNLLIRWRAEDSYGSDLPRPTKEIADARPNRRPRPARPARPARSRSRVVPAPPPAHHGAAPAGSAAPDDRDLSPDEIAAELARLDAQARAQREQRQRQR